MTELVFLHTVMQRHCCQHHAFQQEMMNAVEASGAYEGAVEFTGAPGASSGKRMDNSATRNALGWAPRYASFGEFAAAGARDFYSSEAWAG